MVFRKIHEVLKIKDAKDAGAIVEFDTKENNVVQFEQVFHM